MAAAKEPPLALQQREAARLVGVSPKTLREWEARGKITPVRPGGRVTLYRRADLLKLLGIETKEGTR